MINIARKLSKNISFVRVDLYFIDCKIFFGEMTFYPSCGFGNFFPDSFDKTLGSFLQLPNQ
jgi:hypothetical protein